jgi:imidazoleglycerol-phosphate dehydratase
MHEFTREDRLMRQAQISRQTRETDVAVELTLEGDGAASVATSIGFLDHMLTLLAKHAGLSLAVRASGDLQVDGHHTAEDIGIVLGQALAQALGDKRGIRRYGQAAVPMDEALATAVLDISGRPYLVFNARFTNPMAGDFATELTEEFFRAVAFQAGLTLHLDCPYGQNDHHKIEALFKAFARALAQAVAIDPARPDEVLSTKGML